MHMSEQLYRFTSSNSIYNFQVVILLVHLPNYEYLKVPDYIKLMDSRASDKSNLKIRYLYEKAYIHEPVFSSSSLSSDILRKTLWS